ncbi:N-acetylmuramoyl-L-alanine amidase-like domain-containing protein [Maribacter sp. HTCC2170]|uniref:N-acetylmuramoyl-L-alanine amidase-like domain-containing protein n=1 Tax=Maribacter sp. (strain HTCC2170 / KCCM 42371) TaxID=313603 RepID=UPI0005A2DCD0|nr:N-acetylmuramoyl-L-alanine amidase-like domain-containing protein [Maribacter sp. HTCC2170]
MRFLSIFLMLFGLLKIGNAQQITCSVKDKQAFEDKVIEVDGYLEKDLGKTLISVGKTFLGTAYVAKTLEIGETETLVVNLHGLDCTTYVENVLAFSLLLKDEKSDFDSFVDALETIRYKNGKLDGYASRLHYFSEWITNNEVKGLIKDMTSEIGGVEITKKINFMSEHRELYPFLKDDTNFEKIKASENFLNNEAICYLPQDQIGANEHLIQSGDIIALTTSINGLDITHTGFASREKNGRIHLLHASSSGEVMLSEEPLVDYLKKVKKNTGIMVARVQ